MPKTTQLLTAAIVKAAEPGAILWDSRVSGLHIRVTAHSRSWMLYYRTRAGVQRRPRIGAYPEMSCDAAREVARDLKEQVARGHDPSGAWSATRDAPTVADICDRYIADWLPRKAPHSQSEDRRTIARLILPEIGTVKVAALTAADVERWHARVATRQTAAQRETRGPATAPSAAKHALACLSKILSLCETRYRDAADVPLRPKDSNPCAAVQAAPQRKRRRKASPAELASIVRALRELRTRYPGKSQLIECMIYTAARQGELVHAKRGDVRGSQLIMVKHKTDADVGERVLSLPSQALDVLASVEYPRGATDLFPWPRTLDHVMALRVVWDRVRDMTGIEGLQIRDLRRTFASVSVSGSTPIEHVSSVLGHTTTDMTRTYAHVYDDVAAGAAQSAADAITRLIDASNRATGEHSGGSAVPPAATPA